MSKDKYFLLWLLKYFASEIPINPYVSRITFLTAFDGYITTFFLILHLVGSTTFLSQDTNFSVDLPVARAGTNRQEDSDCLISLVSISLVTAL